MLIGLWLILNGICKLEPPHLCAENLNVKHFQMLLVFSCECCQTAGSELPASILLTQLSVFFLTRKIFFILATRFVSSCMNGSFAMTK